MNIVICEDEIHFATHLNDIVQQYLKQKHFYATILVYSSGEEFLSSGGTPDIILMDIKLSGKNGMDTMKRLREAGCRSQVIFITAYPEYVFQAFDVDAIQYLEKPINQPKLFSALDKAWNRAVADNGKAIILTKRAIVSKVRIKDIIYCEVFNHQTIIHTLSDQYSYGKTRKQTDCDGQTGYTAHILDGIIDKLVRQIFERMKAIPKSEIVNARYREKMEERKTLLRSVRADYTKAADELDMLKAEVIKALRGESAFSKDLLSSIVSEAEAKCTELQKQFEAAQAAYEEGQTVLHSLESSTTM